MSVSSHQVYHAKLDVTPSHPARKAARDRLVLFLEAYVRNGRQLQIPEGLQMPNSQLTDEGFVQLSRGDDLRA